MTTDGDEKEEENIEPSILKFGVSYRFSPPPPPQHKKERRNECHNTSARKMTRPPNGYNGEGVVPLSSAHFAASRPTCPSQSRVRASPI